MKLSADLDAILCSRYPGLFANREGDPQCFAMGRGFEVGPGWFPLVETLSALLSADPPCVADQVKSKFGSLTFRVHPCRTWPSAIDLATAMSRRLCEVSGHPGRLYKYQPLWLATLAPGVRLPGRPGVPDVVPSVLDRAEPGFHVPPLGFTVGEMTALRANVLAAPARIPVGWHDLADTVLQLFQCSPIPRLVLRLSDSEDGLRVDSDGKLTKLAELSEMVRLLSRRIDRMTGAMA